VGFAVGFGVGAPGGGSGWGLCIEAMQRGGVGQQRVVGLGVATSCVGPMHLMGCIVLGIESGDACSPPPCILLARAQSEAWWNDAPAPCNTQLAHHGMIFVPPGYSFGAKMFDMSAAKGGSPWGAGTLAGPDGSRKPSEDELEYARHQVRSGAGLGSSGVGTSRRVESRWGTRHGPGRAFIARQALDWVMQPQPLPNAAFPIPLLPLSLCRASTWPRSPRSSPLEG
jgi:hypothetical protein